MSVRVNRLSDALAIAAMCAALADLAAARQTAAPTPPGELSQQETELRVKADVSRRLGVPAQDVRVIESAERTWLDAGLGCNARRGVLPESRTAGFRIIVEAGTRRLTYHTDRRGRLLRCANPGKPLDPIK